MKTTNSKSPNAAAIRAAKARPWQEVQVLDPEIPPLASFKCAVEITTEGMPRFQDFTVRVPPGSTTGELTLAAEATAKALGFIPTGWVVTPIAFG